MWRSHEEPLGFIGLQVLLDEGIMRFINYRLGENANPSSIEKVDISLVRMPIVFSKESWREFYPSALFCCLLASLTIFSLMRVNSEKSSGFKEFLRMHGVSISTQWMAWLMSSFVVYSVWTLVLTVLLWFPLMGGVNVLTLYNVNFIVHWLLLLLFMVAVTTLSYLISVFFERVWTAASIGLLIWSLFTFLMMWVSGIFHRLTADSMIALMLIPTVTFSFANRLIQNGGGTLATFGVPVIDNIPVTVAHCLIMLLIDSCIYMILAVYLDNVLPSKYGVSQSPWYILWNFKTFLERKIGIGGNFPYWSTQLEDNFNLEVLPTASQPFEIINLEDAKAAVVLNNLKKQYRYSKKRAVDGLSAKMFMGEIYALLGFNGAGKTTTVGMLTGLFAPTSGWATIFDLDIRKDIEKIREHTGLCPQHNLLYDDMSVLDHVAFFARLKGLLNPEDNAKELLTLLGIGTKIGCKTEQLSGGQKRLVHLAIALIGDTTVAFLDEPTSGLDPESRRNVWNILLKLRGKVTIILTTHNMEEADILADRVGIMSEGKMMCSGTPSFLKKYYGSGYNLKMNSVASHCDSYKVVKFVREFISTAKLNTGEPKEEDGLSKSRMNSVVSITLPTAQLDLSRVADMMDAIQQQKSALGVDNIGLSLSSMNDVFLKVGEAARVVDIPSPTSAFDWCSRNVGSSTKMEGSQLQRYRFKALVQKRAAYYCHAPFTIVLLVFVFNLFLWLSLTFFHSSVLEGTGKSNPPQVVSSLEQYRSPVIAFLQESERLSNPNDSTSYALSYKNQLDQYSNTKQMVDIKMLPCNETFTDILNYLKIVSLQDLVNYRQKYLIGASFNFSEKETNITGFYSAYGYYTAPLSLNLISQARIEKLLGVVADIRVTEQPLRMSPHLEYIVPEKITSDYFHFIVKGTVILLVITASLLISTAAFLPTEERLNGGKQMQLMTGTTPLTYWMAMFTWDFPFFSLANIIITLVFLFAESNSDHKIFTGHGAWAVIYLILECHTFGALWFSYLVSWATCIKTPSDGFLIVNKFAVIVGVLANVMSQNLVVSTFRDFQRGKLSHLWKFLYYVGDLSGYVLWPVPMHSLFTSMMKLAVVGNQNNICNTFPPDVLHVACEKVDGFERSENVTWFMHSCCGNCQENCFQPKVYLDTSTVELLPGYHSHGLVVDLLAMLVSGLVSAAILYFLEYELPKRIAKRQYHDESSANPLIDEASLLTSHDDVKAEGARIDNIVLDGKSGGVSSPPPGFIAQNLKLNFGLVSAVSGLSFGVSPGECFGLLGVSGAGKTSTFRVITGDINPTSGNMFSNGQGYHKQRSSYLTSMGYCPQFDGIIGRLTGLQMVTLYGALRGIPPCKLVEEARLWLDKFGLLGSANLKCAAYSGGMKRRLSVTMALIGNPPTILLDEPTSGVDPVFRRQFRNVINELKGKHQSILLTSYSMDECEVLCTRLGIMVKGQFTCFGNPRHLKSKFGQGYILTVKLKIFSELDGNRRDDLVDRLQEKIAESFTPCCVQSQQKVMIQYQILNESLWYSDIFRRMEQICNDPDAEEQVIDEYSVTETSLEDVFLSFGGTSRKQTD